MSISVKKGIILAAGMGRRMRPITETIPKPLVRVCGKPLVDYALDHYQKAGIEQVVVNTSYLAELLEAHLKKRTSPRVIISREEVPLETGGGIKKALPHLGTEPFVSCNSDAICVDGVKSAILSLAERFDPQAMDALLLLHPVKRAVGYDGAGDFFIEEEGALRRRADAPEAPYVFTGLQIIHPRLFKDSPEGVFSLTELFLRAEQDKAGTSRVRGMVHDGEWLHVGDPQGLAAAEQTLNAKIPA